MEKKEDEFPSLDDNTPISNPETSSSQPKKESQNFKWSDIKNIKIIKNIHSTSIWTITPIKNGKVISCSQDGTIKMIDIEKGESLFQSTIPFIRYISYKDDTTLLTCTLNSTIHILQINESSFTSIAIIQTQSKSLNKVIPIHNSRIATCSIDGAIEIFSSEPPYNSVKCLREHNNFLYSIIEMENNKFLVSAGSRDKTLRFWNLETYQREQMLKVKDCADCPNSLCQLDENKLLLGGKNVITIINCEMFQIITEINNKAFDNVYCFLPLLNDDVILFGDFKGNLFEMDKNSYHFGIIREKGHKLSINCMISVTNDSFASVSNEKVIRIWKRKTTK